MPPNGKIVRRVRVLTYVGPENWVKAVTEAETRYVNSVREFPPNGKITESLGEIEEVPSGS